MSVLYLDRPGLQLESGGQCLVLRATGERPQSVPLRSLERVIVHGAAQIDARALAALGAAGVEVMCVSGHARGRIGLLPATGYRSAGRRLGQYAAQQSPEFRLAWSRQLLRAKLRCQRRWLTQLAGTRTDLRRTITRATATVDTALARLPEAPSLAVLRGHEGAAAAAWFATFAQSCAPALGFNGRQRRPPRDPVNATLSLGYSLASGEATFAALAAGLDPYLGLFHEPAWNHRALASDLIEPLRPRVDALVHELFRKGELRADQYRTEDAGLRLGPAASAVFFPAWERELARPARRWLRRVCVRLGQALLTLSPAFDAGEEDDL